MSSSIVDWTPLDQTMIDAHSDPSLLRMNKKELRKVCPHLVGLSHMQSGIRSHVKLRIFDAIVTKVSISPQHHKTQN